MKCRAVLRLALYLSVGLAVTGIIPSGSGKAGLVPAAIAKEPAKPAPQVGVASWYGAAEAGKLTASGKPFDPHKLTAAHRTLPFNSKVKVTNLHNGKSVKVTITDRGPAVPGRVIDLSAQAAKKLGMKKKGLAAVKIQPVPKPRPETAEVR
ncbi:MAG: septal ring lytic transglycosylase RlpA family protein [Stellaceae bacterium]